MFTIDLGDDAALRLWETRDAEALYRLIDANRELLAPWMPWAPGQTPDGTREYIAGSRREWADGTGAQAAITADGAIVGAVGLSRLDLGNRSASVGYWLAAEAQGRGLATRATAAMLDHAFGVLGLHRVELRAAPANAPSLAVARRLGFTREGVMRDAEWLGNHWIDHVLHSMVAGEWAARGSGAGRGGRG